jgi:hypothetical protein
MVSTYIWNADIIGDGDETGACCVGTVCSQTTQANCTGVFKGVGVPCTPSPCGTIACKDNINQSTCETAGCYWYAYPNPFGEPACFDKPIYIQYLPIIVVGIGAIIVVAALLGRKKQTYYPPPPQYYPPYGGR